MNKENTKKLIDDFPKLYRGAKLPKTENLMSYGFSCEDGWFNLIYELSDKITKLYTECIAIQVKEKFGGLRFYVVEAPESVFDLIRKYESKSFKTCEFCGVIENVSRRNTGWVHSLCDNCFLNYDQFRKEQIERYRKEWEEKKNE